MTDKPTDKPPVAADDAPLNPQRRRLLGGMALAGAALTLGGCGPTAGSRSAAVGVHELLPDALDALLRQHIQHVVVLYAENRSFNNLFAHFPGLAQPLKDLHSPEYQQQDRKSVV